LLPWPSLAPYDDPPGQALAAFLKAIGYIIPLMDAECAQYYTKEVMLVLVKEFSSSDEEMKKIVLKVVKQCVATEGVTPAYIRSDIIPEFFAQFWVRRMALDKRNYKQLGPRYISPQLPRGWAGMSTSRHLFNAHLLAHMTADVQLRQRSRSRTRWAAPRSSRASSTSSRTRPSPSEESVQGHDGSQRA